MRSGILFLGLLAGMVALFVITGPGRETLPQLHAQPHHRVPVHVIVADGEECRSQDFWKARLLDCMTEGDGTDTLTRQMLLGCDQRIARAMKDLCGLTPP